MKRRAFIALVATVILGDYAHYRWSVRQLEAACALVGGARVNTLPKPAGALMGTYRPLEPNARGDLADLLPLHRQEVQADSSALGCSSLCVLSLVDGRFAEYLALDFVARPNAWITGSQPLGQPPVPPRGALGWYRFSLPDPGGACPEGSAFEVANASPTGLLVCRARLNEAPSPDSIHWAQDDAIARPPIPHIAPQSGYGSSLRTVHGEPQIWVAQVGLSGTALGGVIRRIIQWISPKFPAGQPLYGGCGPRRYRSGLPSLFNPEWSEFVAANGLGWSPRETK